MKGSKERVLRSSKHVKSTESAWERNKVAPSTLHRIMPTPNDPLRFIFISLIVRFNCQLWTFISSADTENGEYALEFNVSEHNIYNILSPSHQLTNFMMRIKIWAESKNDSGTA